MSYDPTIGRFITEDPIAFKGEDANLYRYVGNEPTNAFDPSGLYKIIFTTTWSTNPWTPAEMAAVNAQLTQYSTMITANIGQISAFQASLTPCEARAIGSKLNDLLAILNEMANQLASTTPLYLTHSPNPKGDSGQHIPGWFNNTIWLNDSSSWSSNPWILFHELSHDSGAVDGYFYVKFVGPLMSPDPWDPNNAANLQSLGNTLFNNTQFNDDLLNRAQSVCSTSGGPGDRWYWEQNHPNQVGQGSKLGGGINPK